ncbi:hypothetical protein ACET3Z_020125 [Daucus carota]
MKLLSGITLSLLLALLFATTITTDAHNITRILAKHPEFSTFNHYLTITHLAAEINRRLTITVCAVDNAARSFTKSPIVPPLLLPCFKQLARQKEYLVMSTLLTLKILTSPEAEAPVAAPSVNITDIMKAKGCKAFSDLLTSEGAMDTFVQTVDGGLTIFCPSDDVLKSFMPKYKNLTEEGKLLILLYHGVPEYNSMGTLRSHNGVIDTLALEGVNSYNFTVQNDDEGVSLKTKVVTASIKATLVDDEPLAVYKIDKVLLPRELFNTDAPKSKKGSTSDDEEAEAPGPADDEDAADDTASDDNSSTSIGGVRIVVTVLLGLLLGVLASL